MVTKQITKVCLRHLPPDMTSDELLQLIGPLPPHNYYKFHNGDISLFPVNMTRAYLSFPNFEHVMEFQAKFDGQIFESKSGTEYICSVEAAPSQFTPNGNQKDDSKYENTIMEDSHYLKFLKQYEQEPAAIEQINVDEYLQEVAQKEEERKKPISTPLIEFIRAKKDKKKAARDARRKQEDVRRKERNEARKSAKALDRKEKNSRKKDLIESKNHERPKEGNSRVDGGGDQREEKRKPEGGRMAARERRKKEAEERRKQKVADRKKSTDPSEKGPEEQKSERPPKKDRARYAKRGPPAGDKMSEKNVDSKPLNQS